MKRRNFVKAILGLAAIPTVVKAGKNLKDIGNEEVPLIEYGNIGLQRVRVIGDRFRIITEEPYYDWVERKLTTRRYEFSWGKTEPSATPDPWLVAPVNEKSVVFVKTENYGTVEFRPEWDGEKFKPHEYVTNIGVG